MPWLLFFPQPVASIAATLIIVSQLLLVITGNYAWLNWVTILISVSATSDAFLLSLVGGRWSATVWDHATRVLRVVVTVQSPALWTLLIALVCVVLLALSRQALANLCSSKQRMNVSSNRWQLVNA